MKDNLKSVTVCWEPVVEEVESESCESRWQLVVTVYLLTFSLNSIPSHCLSRTTKQLIATERSGNTVTSNRSLSLLRGNKRSKLAAKTTHYAKTRWQSLTAGESKWQQKKILRTWPSLVTTGLVWSCCKTNFADLGFQPDPCTEAPPINPTKYIFTIFEWADMVILCQISKVTEKEKKKLFQQHFSLQSNGIIEMLPNS